MRSTIASLLTAAFLLSASLPALAQKPVCFYNARGEKVTIPRGSARSKARIAAAGPVKREQAAKAVFSKIRAVSDGNGAVVSWDMQSEAANLGFLVYRGDPADKQLVSEVMTMGSAAMVGRQPLYGQTYSVFDPKGGIDTAYSIMTIGMNGERQITDPVTSTYEAESADEVGPARNIFTISNNNEASLENIEPRLTRRSQQASDLAMHRWVVNQPAAKIGVRTDGLYRVYLNSLVSVSGVFNSGNTGGWRLFRDGVEQAILIGSDTNGSYMEFYGRGLDTRESDTRTYYLIADAVTPGLRMARPRLVVETGGASASYNAVLEKKERNSFNGNIINGDAENWWGRAIIFGDGAGSSTANVTFTLSALDTSQLNSQITVKLHGLSLTQFSPLVRVRVNGNLVGDMGTDLRQTPFSQQFTIPTSFLLEGSNTLGLTSLGGDPDPNANPRITNTEMFDTVTVNYARRYQAIANKLSFTAPQHQSADLTGFTSRKVRLFNIQSEDEPMLIGRVDAVQSGTTFTVKWPANARNSGKAVFAVEDSAALQPAVLTGNTPSSLSATVQPADLIVISDPAYMSTANAWAAYRRGQGFSVAVIDVDDIMDEYSYGASTSKAIADFLAYVKLNWAPQVAGKQYVLLLGDSTLDPKKYWPSNTGRWNQVPTKIVPTVYSEVGSDEALADFDGDGLAEMAVGRIPFRTPAAVAAAFNKTVAFESSQALQSVDRGAVFAYDVPNGYNFALMSEQLSEDLPASTPKTFVRRGKLPPYGPNENELTEDPAAHGNLMTALNAGPYIVNYSGHGSQSTWATQSFFNNSAVNTQLVNGSNQSIYMMLTCLNGYFVGFNGAVDESIAEVLLKNPNGGGPAAWASTGLTTADVQMIMGHRFMSQIGIGDIPRMGDLVRDAKAVIPAGADVRFSWALFGDPMLKVR